MKTLSTVVLLLLLSALLPAFAAPKSNSNVSLYEGQHFLLGFMTNEVYILDSEVLSLRVYITTKRPTRVTIKAPWDFSNTYMFAGDTVITVSLHPDSEVRVAERPVHLAWEIESTEPIAVYAFSSLSKSSDAYAVIPTASWGTEYFAMSMSNDTYNLYATKPTSPVDSALRKIPRLGECMVIASEDSTIVCYTPTCSTYTGVPPGATNKVVLNKGECFLIASKPNIKNTNDLTGTFVIADKPIGFVSGHMRTSIPHLPDAQAGEEDTKDHLIEMLPSVDAWGKTYVSAPLGVCMLGDYFRVMAAQDSTIISVQTDFGILTDTINRGEFTEYDFIDSPAKWTANKPILLGQFMYSDYLDPFTNADPCFVVLPPTDRFVQRLIFQAPSTTTLSQFDQYYVQIICSEDALASLQFNKQRVVEIEPNILTQNIFDSKLHWARIKVEPNKVYTVAASDGDFSGIIYAHGSADSYGVPLGTSFLLSGDADTVAPLVTASEKCGKIQGKVVDTLQPASGLFEVYMEEDSSYNYTFSKDPITDTSTVLHFTAEPRNLDSNARIVITAVDKAGNTSQYTFVYTAPSLSVQPTIALPKVSEGNTACAPVQIVNTGDTSVVISGLYPMSDPRIQLTPPLPAFPLTLDSGDTIEIEVCYTATADTAALQAQLLLRYGCQRQRWIHIGHTAEQPDIATIGWDFGDVRVGDTACAAVAIVNTGNVPLVLTDLSNLQYPDNIQLDTAGVFPVSLNPNDTLRIRTCFTPTAQQQYTEDIHAGNTYNLTTSIPITGRGTAPTIVVEHIDWKQRRVGTTNDTLVTIANRGTATAVIEVSTSSTVSSSVIAYSSTGTFPLALAPGSTATLSARFTPEAPVGYTATLVFSVDWRFHLPVHAVLEGEGTLPVIATKDIDFGTIPVYTKRDTIATALFSQGNEQLTIDTIFFASGDKEAFLIEPNSWKGRVLAQGTTSTIQARFQPTAEGNYRATLGVIHDAKERYLRDTAYVVLTGTAYKLDTLRSSITLQTSGALYSCQDNTLALLFDNIQSNRTVVVDSFAVLALGTETVISVTPPVSIDAGKSAVLPPFAFSPQQAGAIPLRITAFYHRKDGTQGYNVVLNTTVDVYRSQLTINPGQKRDVTPWSKPMLYLSGTIAKGQMVSGNVVLDIGYNYQSFRPLQNVGTLTLIHNGSKDTLRLPTTIVEHRQGMTITGTPFADIALPATWETAIPMFVFLDTLQAPSMTVAAQSNACIAGDTIQIPIELTGVCSYAYRNIRYFSPPSSRLYPNPTTESTVVELSLPEDDLVSLTIVDALGRSFPVAEKMYLKKGKYSYKLPCADFNSGIYSLVVIFSNSVRQHHFIINK